MEIRESVVSLSFIFLHPPQDKKKALAIHDTGAVSSCLRHRAVLESYAPDHPGTATAVLGWLRAIIEAIVCPKRPST